MSKVIVATNDDGVIFIYPAPRTMSALTAGGFGRLPGDAVTSDLGRVEAEKEAAVLSMDRAVENMINSGRDPIFAQAWCRALVLGGETDASALDMIRIKDAPADTSHEAVDIDDVPVDQTFRDAWRWNNGIYIDMAAARNVFIDRVIGAKTSALADFGPKLERALLRGEDTDALEAQFFRLKEMDLHKLRDAIVKADTPEALKALWPASLPA